MSAESLSAAAVPHVHADLVAAFRSVLAEVGAVEPIAVDEREAARLLSCSPKTVARIPDDQIGRLRIGEGGRSVRYLVASLRQYAETLAGKPVGK